WRPLVLIEPQWDAARKKLAELEGVRRDTRRWYAQELTRLDAAPDPKAPTVLGEIKIVPKENTPEIAPGGDPTFKTAIPTAMQPTANPEVFPDNVYDLKQKELLAGVEGGREGLDSAKRQLRLNVEQTVEESAKMLGEKGLYVRGENEKVKREGKDVFNEKTK